MGAADVSAPDVSPYATQEWAKQPRAVYEQEEELPLAARGGSSALLARVSRVLMHPPKKLDVNPCRIRTADPL